MKRVISLFFIASCFCANAFAGINLVAEVRPLSALYTSKLKDFKATKDVVTITSSSTTTWSTITTVTNTVTDTTIEEAAGSLLAMPNVVVGFNVGIGETLKLEPTVGVGYLYGKALSSIFYSADLALRFSPVKSFSFGPHVGLMRLGNLDWKGDSLIDLKNTNAVVYGIVGSLGGDIMSLSLGLDYVNADLKYSESGSWVGNKSKFDISGIGVNLGLRFKF